MIYIVVFSRPFEGEEWRNRAIVDSLPDGVRIEAYHGNRKRIYICSDGDSFWLNPGSVRILLTPDNFEILDLDSTGHSWTGNLKITSIFMKYGILPLPHSKAVTSTEYNFNYKCPACAAMRTSRAEFRFIKTKEEFPELDGLLARISAK